jgi:hypothetical protein
MPILQSSPVPDRWLLVVRGLTQVIVEIRKVAALVLVEIRTTPT